MTCHASNVASRSLGLAISCVLVLLLAETLLGTPTVSSVTPRGLQIGGTTRLTVVGTQLDANPRLHPLRGARTDVIQSKADRLVIDVTIHDEMSAGMIPLRVVTDRGISNATMIGVDRLPQIALQDEIESTPVALHGHLSGDQKIQVSFHGKAEQPVVIDLEGNRLGSKIRPSLRLLDSEGRQIAWSLAQSALAGDARIEHILPRDGRYTIALHDIVHKGPSPGFFRLKIGDLRYADLVFPPAVPNQMTTEVNYVSSNIHEPTLVHGSANVGISSRTVPWPSDARHFFTGAKPRIVVSPFGPGELTEDKLADRMIPLIPAGVSGRIADMGEEDEYVIDVTRQRKLRLEIFAQRLGSPLDAVLIAATKGGKELARNDDQGRTRDPGLDVDVPDDVKQLFVRVVSLTGQHGADCVYRLSVTPRESSWKLSTDLDRLNLPAGSRQIVLLNVDRGGSSGTLDLALPPSVSDIVRLESARVRPEDEFGLISFQSSETSRGVFPVAVTGMDESPGSRATITMSTAEFPGSRYQPDLREQLVIAVTSPSPLDVSWAEPDLPQLARGTTRPITIRLQRDAAAGTGKVRLSLITSQKTPMKKEKDKQVIDLNRALRINGSPVVDPDAETYELKLTAPVELPQHSWCVAVKAELLSNDQKQVRATAYTRIRRLETIQPVELQVEPPGEISVQLEAAEPATIRGKLLRHPDFPVWAS